MPAQVFRPFRSRSSTRPDNISRKVLDSGLDAQTAFEIVSIDIADVDVGDNVGAQLQAAQAEADERELEAEELAATLEAKGQKRGADFVVVSNRLGGVFALRRPDTRAIRNGENASDKNKLSLEWNIGLLRHYIVEPDEKAPGKALLWAQTSAQRPGLCWQTASAFVELMGVDVDSYNRKS